MAKPRIEAALESIAESGQDVVFVEAMVARAEYKGKPEYPYRTHEHLRINDIPSLFKWGRTKPIAKLQGDQLDSTETILSLLSD